MKRVLAGLYSIAEVEVGGVLRDDLLLTILTPKNAFV